MDLFWGYWQVALTEASKPKTAFFIPNGKKRFTVMPMGATNSHQAYNAIIKIIKAECDNMAADMKIGTVHVTRGRDLQGVGSQNITDDIILHSEKVEWLLTYFECLLKTFLKYRVTISLRKTRFFPTTAEFVGIDVRPEGNTPSAAKDKAFQNLRIHLP